MQGSLPHVPEVRRKIRRMLASAAVTTGLFVLAGVVVGALVTGVVNYGFEWRRARLNTRVALRLLETELASADDALNRRINATAWWPWPVGESARRTWGEHRSELAGISLSSDDWYAIYGAFNAIEVIESELGGDQYRPLAVDDMRKLVELLSVILEGSTSSRKA